MKMWLTTISSDYFKSLIVIVFFSDFVKMEPCRSEIFKLLLSRFSTDFNQSSCKYLGDGGILTVKYLGDMQIINNFMGLLIFFLTQAHMELKMSNATAPTVFI